MRKKLIAGNWKMFKTNSEALQLANQVKIKTTEISKTKIVMCPPFTALAAVADVVRGTKIGVGAQNLYWEKEGAFTAEISAGMIKSTGAAYVIIGHSERRQYFGETDATVNKRLISALENGLTAIVCVGETLNEREANVTRDVVGKQIRGAFNGITASDFSQIIVAYEPVWAIGTGKTATPDQAQEVHAYLRQVMADEKGREIAESLQILYGGSVKPENASELLSQKDIDGALVGGACLNADSFGAIIHSAEAL
jgi:triosephosphate isomerase